MKPKNPASNTILSSDWFFDGDGQKWAFDAIDPVTRQVRLRMVSPPRRTISLTELRANYTLTSPRSPDDEIKSEKAKVPVGLRRKAR